MSHGRTADTKNTLNEHNERAEEKRMERKARKSHPRRDANRCGRGAADRSIVVANGREAEAEPRAQALDTADGCGAVAEWKTCLMRAREYHQAKSEREEMRRGHRFTWVPDIITPRGRHCGIRNVRKVEVKSNEDDEARGGAGKATGRKLGSGGGVCVGAGTSEARVRTAQRRAIQRHRRAVPTISCAGASGVMAGVKVVDDDVA
ncbi:hypothetical protein C8R45DRAFT_1072619 [Mycena sanguinolenta]|nr:hypothetical protein C8R45DRAFT_1072619 [Mycena sanguinolenta]